MRSTADVEAHELGGYLEQHKRVQLALQERGLQAVLCLLPENILYLSGYWPSTAESAIIYPLEARPVLVVPRVDLRFIPADWWGEVIEYRVDANDIRSNGVRDKFVRAIGTALSKTIKPSMAGTPVGSEDSFETIAGSFRGAESTIPGQPLRSALIEVARGLDLADSTAMLLTLRHIKNERQVRALRACNEIAGKAFAMLPEHLVPGAREVDVAAALERDFEARGVGYQGVERARAYAFVMSGSENAANAWLPANFSTNRRVESGDLVVIEFNAFADGYWVDLSRTHCVGVATQRQKEVHESVTQVLNGVLACLKPGLPAAEVDVRARALLRDAGLDSYFEHYIGHGVGFAFHEPPILSEGSETVLQDGMVLAIEPGVYIPGWGGVRIEENVAIGRGESPTLLSAFNRSLTFS